METERSRAIRERVEREAARPMVIRPDPGVAAALAAYRAAKMQDAFGGTTPAPTTRADAAEHRTEYGVSRVDDAEQEREGLHAALGRAAS